MECMIPSLLGLKLFFSYLLRNFEDLFIDLCHITVIVVFPFVSRLLGVMRSNVEVD